MISNELEALHVLVQQAEAQMKNLVSELEESEESVPFSLESQIYRAMCNMDRIVEQVNTMYHIKGG